MRSSVIYLVEVAVLAAAAAVDDAEAALAAGA